MKNNTFTDILRYIKLPCGTLLSDGTTYRLERADFPTQKFRKDLELFEKMLVLSDGKNNVVGGVLFYGNVDIQATTLPEYRNRGYMCAISKNGILQSECYDGQQVSIAPGELENMDDFLLRYHLLQIAGLKVKNLKEIFDELNFFRAVSMREDEFIKRYSSESPL